MDEIPYDKLVLIVRRQENDIINHKKRLSELEARTDPRRDGDKTSSLVSPSIFRGGKPMHENVSEWNNDIHNMKLRLETANDGELQVIRIQTNTCKGYEHMAWINFVGKMHIDEKETNILKDYGYKIIAIEIKEGWISVRVSNK